jgi:hypothetical protein
MGIFNESKGPFIEIGPGDTREEARKDGSMAVTSILIPECCREGWESCRHVAKRQRPIRNNIGL